jgi:hypothetical protein
VYRLFLSFFFAEYTDRAGESALLESAVDLGGLTEPYSLNNRVLNIPRVASGKNFRPDDLEMKRVFFVPNSKVIRVGIWNEENPFHFKIIGAKIFEFFFHWPVYVYLTVFY